MSLAISTLLLISACGQLQCDLLGSGTLREQCRDNEVIMTIYAVPTYFPGQGGL